MTTVEWIQFWALLVAIASLVIQQTRWIRKERKSDLRNANKLKIYYACQTDTGLTEEEIISQYRRSHPTETMNDVETRKTIYEMLSEGTLYYLWDEKSQAHKYKARRRVKKADEN